MIAEIRRVLSEKIGLNFRKKNQGISRFVTSSVNKVIDARNLTKDIMTESFQK